MDNFWERTYKFEKQHQGIVSSYLQSRQLQYLAINESGTALHGGNSIVWIVCIGPDQEILALLDILYDGNWETFPQGTVACGYAKKPSWVDLRAALQRTKYGQGASMHGFRRDWVLFNGEWGSLTNAVKLIKGDLQCVPNKEIREDPVTQEVKRKAAEMSSIISERRDFSVEVGRKWIRIDYYSGGGWLMVDVKSGDVYKTRGYLQVDLRKKVGNVFALSARDIIQKVSPFLLETERT